MTELEQKTIQDTLCDVLLSRSEIRVRNMDAYKQVERRSREVMEGDRCGNLACNFYHVHINDNTWSILSRCKDHVYYDAPSGPHIKRISYEEMILWKVHGT